jgi:hypothetical protein
MSTLNLFFLTETKQLSETYGLNYKLSNRFLAEILLTTNWAETAGSTVCF